MKRMNYIILLFLPILLNAQNEHSVSLREAETVAKSWIVQRFGNYPLNINDTYVYTDSINNPIFYEIKTDSVSLLLTGNKACIPVIGVIFGSDKHILESYIMKTLPEGLLSLIDEYKTQVKYCYDRLIPGATIHNSKWQEMLVQNNQKQLVRTTQVGPLTKSKWTQNKPNYGNDLYAYNWEIPPDSNNTCEHCLVGCVAVAMGQLMYYYQYPTISKKVPEQFDWCNMTNILDNSGFCPTYNKNRKAIAHLLRECGRIVNMHYGCSASYARTSDCRDALITGFGYDTGAIYLDRVNFSTREWIDMLKNNLDNNMPLIYRGEGSSNHTFLCHGYRDNNLFCFNWGNYISNYYNEDFFTLENLTPYNNDFSYRHAAIFNIHPPSQTDICENNLILNDFYRNNIFIGFPFYFNPYDITPKTSTVLTSASIEAIPLWRTIPENAKAVYQAHREIVLRDGFTAEYGCDFTAKIEPCVRCEDRGNDDNADDESDIYTGAQDDSEEVPAYAVGHPSAADGLYPNPTDGQVTVAADGEVEAIVIYTTDGRPVGGWKILSLSGDHVTLDVGPLPDGLYILSLRTSGGTATHKLIKTQK